MNPERSCSAKRKGYWHDYLVDGESVVNPFDVETLVPRWYQLLEK